MMFAQMNHQPVARDLHVDRSTRLEAMLPINLEAEKIQVKLTRLVGREDAKDRNGALELHCHPLALAGGVVSFQPCRSGFVAPRGQSRYRPGRPEKRCPMDAR